MEDKQGAADAAEPEAEAQAEAAAPEAAAEEATQDEGITKADVEADSAADADAGTEVAEAAPAPVEPESVGEADATAEPAAEFEGIDEDDDAEKGEDSVDTFEDAVETGLGDDPVSVLRAVAVGHITRDEAREWLDAHYPEDEAGETVEF